VQSGSSVKGAELFAQYLAYAIDPQNYVALKIIGMTHVELVVDLIRLVLKAVFEDQKKADVLGMYREAIEAYKQVIRINPDDSGAHYSLGVVYVDLGMYREAMEAFKQAIRIKPN